MDTQKKTENSKTANSTDNRRAAKGLRLPLVYLLLEVALLVTIVYAASQFDSHMVTLFAFFGTIFYFYISVLPRFNAVSNRQKIEREKEEVIKADEFTYTSF